MCLIAHVYWSHMMVYMNFHSEKHMMDQNNPVLVSFLNSIQLFLSLVSTMTVNSYTYYKHLCDRVSLKSYPLDRTDPITPNI